MIFHFFFTWRPFNFFHKSSLNWSTRNALSCGVFIFEREAKQKRFDLAWPLLRIFSHRISFTLRYLPVCVARRRPKCCGSFYCFFNNILFAACSLAYKTAVHLDAKQSPLSVFFKHLMRNEIYSRQRIFYFFSLMSRC